MGFQPRTLSPKVTPTLRCCPAFLTLSRDLPRTRCVFRASKGAANCREGAPLSLAPASYPDSHSDGVDRALTLASHHPGSTLGSAGGVI